MRIRGQGSAGGHNGIKSIIYQLNSDVFPRIKIGVGQPTHAGYDLADYVLSRFTSDDLKNISECVKKVEFAIPTIMKFGVQEAMNNFNGG
jgi:PTH1 family peptidyl-tRNA hydrolase